MKKVLLTMAALAFAGSAFAEEVVLAETDFSKVDSYNFWKPETVDATVKDGALVITNEAATENFWEVQYMVVDNVTLTAGTEYTVSVKIKDFAGTLHYNLGTWSSNVNGGTQVEESSDWQTVSFKATPEADTDGTAHLLLQSGDFVGTYAIESVKITYNEEGGETPDEPVTPPSEGKEVYSIDYSTTTWDFYVMGYTPQNENGVLVSNYPGEWYQYFIADRIVTEAGKSYKAVVKIKTSSAASLALNMGWGWGEGEQAQGTLKTTAEWTEATYTFENVGGNSCNLVLQPGTYDGTVEIEWVKVYEVDGGETPDEPVTPPSEGKEVYSIDYSTTTWDFYVMGYTPQNENGVLVSNYPGEWYQYFIADRIVTEVGKSYTAVVKIKTSTAASLALNMGWGWGEGEQAQGTLKTTTDWTEASYTFENIGGTSSNLVLQPGTYDGTVEIEWVKVYALESSAVEEIAPAVENGRIVVYNLLGVKVLDTDDASQLNTLRKGIYIVNGKKVAL